MTDHEERLEFSRGPSLKFTLTGQKRMEEYQTRFATVLRRAIRDQNPSFTEHTVEVTASDVDKALDGVKLISTRRLEVRRLIFDIYITFGIASVILGVFFTDVESILRDQPIRLALIGSGSLLTLVAVLARRRYKVISIGRPASPGLQFFVSDLDENIDSYNNMRRWQTLHSNDIYRTAKSESFVDKIVTVRDSKTGEITTLRPKRPSKT